MIVRLGNRVYTIDETNVNDVSLMHEAARLINHGCRAFLCAGGLIEDGGLFDTYNLMLHEAALVEGKMKVLVDAFAEEGKYYE